MRKYITFPGRPWFVFHLILWALVAISQPAQAQPLDSDTLYTDSVTAVHNAIKLDLLRFTVGELALLYERRLNDRFSAEVGLGITRRNYLAGWQDYDADNLARNIEVRARAALRIEVRYYLLKSPELNGWYVGPQLAYRHYEKHFNNLNELGDLTGTGVDDIRKITEVGLVIGNQPLGNYGNFFVNYFAGITYQWRNLVIARTIDPGASPRTEYRTETDKRSSVWFTAGFRIGLGF